MDIWLQFNEFCGNIDLSLCGNIKYPKFASAEDFGLFSCLESTVNGEQILTCMYLYTVHFPANKFILSSTSHNKISIGGNTFIRNANMDKISLQEHGFILPCLKSLIMLFPNYIFYYHIRRTTQLLKCEKRPIDRDMTTLCGNFSQF